MKTFIVGCGTIGLAFGVALASHGNRVVLCDRDEDRLIQVKNDQLAFDEPELRTALKNALSSGMISVSRMPEPHGSASNFVLITHLAQPF